MQATWILGQEKHGGPQMQMIYAGVDSWLDLGDRPDLAKLFLKSYQQICECKVSGKLNMAWFDCLFDCLVG